MLSIITKTKLANWIAELSLNLSKLDNVKKVLKEQLYFDPMLLFQRLDTNREGILKIEKINDFLIENGKIFSESDLLNIMEYFQIEKNNKLKYFDFTEKILPNEDSNEKSIIHLKNYNCFNTNSFKLPYELEWALTRLFEEINNCLKSNKELKLILKKSIDFNTKTAFEYISNSNNFIDIEKLKNFLNSCQKEISKRELNKFINFFDLDHDNKISYLEFHKSLSIIQIEENINFKKNEKIRFSDQKNKFINSYYFSTPKKNNLNNRLTNSFSTTKFNSKINSNLTEIKENNLAKIFKKEIKIENEINNFKEVLINNKEFTIEKGFKIFNFENKIKLNIKDFQNCLLNLGIIINIDKIKLFFEKIDLNNDGLIDFSDFEKIFDQFRKDKEESILSQETINLFKLYLKMLINSEKSFDNLRKKLYKDEYFDLNEAFDIMDEQEIGYLTLKEFEKEIKKSGINYSQQNLSNIFNRFDKNKDGKVSYGEFLDEFKPKSPLKNK